jgi:hypothetical protein
LDRKLREHVPDTFEIVLKLVHGPYGYIEWRAREPGKSVEDGADSFLIEGGKIVFQSIHYSVQEIMPLEWDAPSVPDQRDLDSSTAARM